MISNIKFAAVLVILSVLLTTSSCSGSGKEATAEEVKQEIPSELKDTAVLQQDEQSALDKLNSVTDTGAKK